MKTPVLKSIHLFAMVGLAMALLVLGIAPSASAMDASAASGTTLVLRGAGTRIQDARALYTVKLYAASASPDANQIQVVMSRDVKATEINALLASGLVANASDEELSRLIPELFGLGAVIGAQHSLRAGDGFQIVANADRSTTIRIHARGAAQPVEVTFEQPELFPVMLKIWLGPQPVDNALKQALLGQSV
ncbi:MAG: chalcone isomerase family protein [Rhodoferax sp.]|nr:chalcone isomerase family protein [Rhodoferax sp.]